MAWLIVFLGAGIGGALRHGANLLGTRWFGAFPAATMTVNVLGSFAMGLLASWFLARPGYSQDVRLFLTTGLLGGFTTFSAFSLDSVALIQRGQWGLAGLYVAGSVVAAIAALFLGLALTRGAA
jgi:CrcB protein